MAWHQHGGLRGIIRVLQLCVCVQYLMDFGHEQILHAQTRPISSDTVNYPMRYVYAVISIFVSSACNPYIYIAQDWDIRTDRDNYVCCNVHVTYLIRLSHIRAHYNYSTVISILSLLLAIPLFCFKIANSFCQCALSVLLPHNYVYIQG